jgi:hypothetical protein
MLRALRQQPPGLAARDDNRRTTFGAALEQSEQFFAAASAAGPQTRGLLLFYGISQAGRAVRAAQQQEDNWARAGSHGIKVVGESTSKSFAEALVCDTKNKPSDAFGWVAMTLNRASIPRQTRVGDLTRLMFPGAHFPLSGGDPPHGALQLTAVRDSGPSMGRDADVSGLRANLRVPASTWEVPLPDPRNRTTSDYDVYKAHVRTQLAMYPTLAGAELFEATPGYFQPTPDSADTLKLELIWPSLPPWDGMSDAVLHRFSDENRSTVTVWPTLPGADSSELPLATHPFLLWWALLYVFSHFIRYEPGRWGFLVDVDRSNEAVALEEIGDLALDVLPELIHRVLVRLEPQE